MKRASSPWAALTIVGLTAAAGAVTRSAQDTAAPGSVNARAAADYKLQSLAGHSGLYEGQLYQAALRVRARMLAQRRSQIRAGLAISAAAPPSVPSEINWTELGPGSVGGRVNAIWIDPKNAQHLIVGAAGGGLWQSSDGGGSWTAVAEFPGSLAVGAIAQLPNGTLLAGTGDLFNELQPGAGMFISTDGGNTWSPITATAPKSNKDFWSFILSIATNSNGVALTATWGGIERSTDGGNTWAGVWPTGGTGNASDDVVFDPNNPSVAVADNENGSVVYSTDAGQTWAVASGLPGTQRARTSLAFDPSVAESLYALVDNNNGTAPSGEVFHSIDGGKTWALLAGASAFVNQHSGHADGALCDDSTGGTVECQGFYDNVIAVIPQGAGKPPLISVGGIDIFSSTDGGVTWAEVGSWVPGDPNYVHADQHAFAVSATNGTIYVGNDGGMFKTPVTGGTWSQLNTGLAITQFYSVSGHAGTTASLNMVNGTAITPILAGAQDNGMQLYEGYIPSGAPQPNNWVQAAGGDGGIAIVDPVNGNYLYGEYVYLQPEYSSTGGPTLLNLVPSPPDNSTQSANFIAPFALVPNGASPSTQMLAGGATLWLGSNVQSGSPTWSSFNNTTLPVGSTGNYISAIQIDPSNNNNIWVGFDSGQLWYTTNASAQTGPFWVQSANAGFPTSRITSFWVVPGQSATAYATFAGLSNANGSVFVTTDHGQTWTAIGSGLPPGPVYSLVTHPAYPQILYAGTLTGVYTSIDAGQNWTASAQGPANISVNQLSWFDTSTPNQPVLLAATDGRGAWLGSPAYNPTPTLTLLNPAQVTLGSTATVTLNGTGYVGSSTVTLDGLSIAANYLSATQLQVTAPPAVLPTVGGHTFIVSNPIPGGGASAGAILTVAYPSPTVSSLAPISAEMGGPGFTLTINGSGFQPVSTVQWNGSALSTAYVQGSSLTAAVPAPDLSTGGYATVTVTTPTPGGGTANATFAVNYPVPTLSSISPTSATQGASSATLTASGSNYVPTSTIEWNGAALATTYVSATQLTATVPTGDLANVSNASLTVMTPAPGGGTSSAIAFTVSAPAAAGGGGGGGGLSAIELALGVIYLFGLRMRASRRSRLM